MEYPRATTADVPLLAMMNQQLIHDEGHRNRMTLPELEQRMGKWLGREYEAVIFSENGEERGYALYRRDPNWIYLRQFFVRREHRRKGIGRAAMPWLRTNAWKGAPRIRVEALVGNAAALAFWRSLGFADYCLTLELEPMQEQES
jgi:GNAT superfamily N-acetyltransferase